MYNIIRACLIGTITTSLSGCGLSGIASRDTNPVIQDYAGNPIANMFRANIISTFATTASRRMVIIRENKDENGIKSISTCAEPSPDVGEAFASAIADGIKIAAQAEGVPVELSNQYARAVATQITPLVYRTQGLQLYRDAAHGLCIDKMNGWVKSAIDGVSLSDPNSYESQRKYFFDQAASLISQELPIMQATQAAFFANAKVGEAKVNIEDVTKILNAVKPQGK